jgi:hypothetical protein
MGGSDGKPMRGASRPRQFGLATMLATLTLAAIWFGWAEVVSGILRSEAASQDPPERQPAAVFRTP